MSQTEIVNLENLVPANHMYRKFKQLWSFKTVERELKKLESDNNYKVYGLLRLFKCLLLQFMENLRDRELARFIQENTGGKWFCSFSLSENTPDYSVFSRLRKKIGTHKLSEIFADLRNQLKNQGVMSEVFSFVDATHLIFKASLWDERDRAIEAKYEELNNEVLSKFTLPLYDLLKVELRKEQFFDMTSEKLKSEYYIQEVKSHDRPRDLFR